MTSTLDVAPETNAEEQSQAYGQGQHTKRVPGEYKALNEGLVTATAIDNDLQSDYPSINNPELHDKTYHEHDPFREPLQQ